MTISVQELGKRLRRAREQAGLTQEEVAAAMGLTRGAIAQLEGGLRAPNSLQLATMGELYSWDVGDFLRPASDEAPRDAVMVLFHAEAALADNETYARPIRKYAGLCLECTQLEDLLGLDRERLFPAVYAMPSPRNRWEAIHQGEHLAHQERSRLNLGDAPIRDAARLLELQGLRVVEIPLPDMISGIFLRDVRHGLFVMVNRDRQAARRAFSMAHEYCHVLVDRNRTSVVCSTQNRDDHVEIRANAFASAFLMPEGGLRAVLRARGKGEASRSFLRAYSDDGIVIGQKRTLPQAQEMQAYDVVQIAEHFGVAYEMALYRLLNLKIISDEEAARLETFSDAADPIVSDDGVPSATDLRDFRRWLIFLALEAYRRELISRAKVEELIERANGRIRDLQLVLSQILEEGPVN